MREEKKNKYNDTSRKPKVRFDINLTGKQKEAFEKLDDPKTDILVACWSRQSGKSVFAEICIIKMLLMGKRFNAYISPSYSQGKKVFSEILSLLQPTGLVRLANASELRLELRNRASFKCFSMESPTAIRGYTVTGILVLDEAAFFPRVLPSGEEPFSNIIYPLAKARHPKILMISTPNGKQGFFHDYYLRALSGEDERIKLVKASIYDDDLISKEEIEDIKRNISPLAFQQEFMVEFLDDAITVFKGFDECFKDYDFDESARCWIGIDPSTVGEDRTVLSVVNSKLQVKQYVIEGDLTEKYNQIAMLINRINPVMSYIERNSIGEVMKEEIIKLLNKKDRFKGFLTTNESKKEYISLLAVDIANGEIHFDPDNKLLYSELSTFTYKITKNGNITYAAAAGYHDDTITSLGIALQCREDFLRRGECSLGEIIKF